MRTLGWGVILAHNTMKLDRWQQQVMDTKGHICLRSGRQVGKSTVISEKAGEFAINHPKKTIMVISAVERQAALLFEKILSYIYLTKKGAIKTGKDRPTKHKLQLKNGSIIHCLPTGESGYGIRGFTINMLIADEAAFIPEEVWSAVTPMMATTGGDIILLSTPFGREGYFARCFKDKKFTKFHISSEDCPRIDQDFLEHEKQTMSKIQYSQEYLGEFVDELMQLFPDKLITECQTLSRKQVPSYFSSSCFLGVDVARLGGDETTFEIVDRSNRLKVNHIENITETENTITDTARQIIKLDNRYHFKKIYVDSGGLGIGVVDVLREGPSTRRKVVEINNASRPIEHGDKARKKKTLKEDLYNNLLTLMERGQIRLLDDPEIFQSLKSVQYEYIEGGKFKIFGRYTHIAEGLIRAAWCTKDKTLNIYIY